MQVGDILVWLCNLDTDCYFQPRFCRGKVYSAAASNQKMDKISNYISVRCQISGEGQRPPRNVKLTL